ncbi:MAG: PSD1 and planctomycete cytochrome C domain-containing protein [Acidobacteriia bacterium]|nr:PSD1 and planctomycete cytochrome C domain-containing protein [Terriglobia bacterium]
MKNHQRIREHRAGGVRRNLAAAWFALVGSFAALAAGPPVDFQRDIRPLLAKRCFACHGPDEGSRQAGLRLDTFDGATGKNGGRTGIVPGSSAQSRVFVRITHPTTPMPPVGERLSPTEVDLIKRWIDQGAAYTRHWAFAKPVRPNLPSVRNQAWPRSGIDYFVLARLEQENLKPSREADANLLARRAALDLIGLPPAPEWVREFVDDKRPDAYERYIDRLLAMPQFGERWARVWLDLARYADTQGYERDFRRSIWPYRDWVIKAINANMPFDQFSIRQLAGDLLPSPTEDDLIATGFHRNTMTNPEAGSDPEEFRDLAVKDRVAVTGQVWMGLTWGCAQCHTHKYDPISHAEFYQLYAFLNQTQDANRVDDTPSLKIGGGSTLVMRDLPPDKLRVTHIEQRGNFLDPGAEVQAATPAAFFPMPGDAPRNRLGLAEWLVNKENPLTARVTVNRFWARLFGRGIVETEEDFGTQGSSPSHPELLDWLATEFMNSDWNVKAMLKTIVTSATYRQSSDASAADEERDPYNRLLARGARYRLDAEMIHDQMLSVAGLLSSKMYGPPVMPWQPDGIWQVVYNSDQWILSSGEDRYRRSLYTFLRRTSPYPWMTTYDAPTGEVCTMRRIRTNTPLQALASLNDPVSMAAAQRIALRTLDEAGASDQARIAYMFQMAVGRQPSPSEAKRLLALHRDAQADLDAESSQKLLNYDKVLYSSDREIALVADGRGKASSWQYTTQDPGDAWKTSAFDANAWKSGAGPFAFRSPAAQGSAESPAGTPWDSEQLWMRYEFDVPAGPLEDPHLLIRCTGGFEVFLNGVRAAASSIERTSYYKYAIDKPAIAALKPGRNLIAVRAYRIGEKDRGQSIDVGLVAVRSLGPPDPRRDQPARAAWVVVANTILNLDEMLTRR